MYGVLFVILHRLNTFHIGILVRNDVVKDRLQKRLRGSLIMSGLTFLRQFVLSDLCPQDLVREQRPRIQRCQFRFFLRFTLLPTKTKVLLYNFFKDSTATLNQWRLVLNGVPDGGNLPNTPTFDETRHASICVEVCCLRLEPFFPYSYYLGW